MLHDSGGNCNMINTSSRCGWNFSPIYLIRKRPITEVELFCKTTLNSKVIVKGIIDPDGNFWRNSKA